jgi:uncharacterized protein (DUF488 family)
LKTGVILTLGHSVRPLDQTLALLRENGVTLLADVRVFPRSRRNPQYNSGTFAAALQKDAIAYRHMPELGGMRKPKADSINEGLKEQGFRGFADYMRTPEFDVALRELTGLAAQQQLAIMCAEAKPSECHRSLISDALSAHGVEVRHIIGPVKTEPHAYTRFAVVQGARVTYPFSLQG